MNSLLDETESWLEERNPRSHDDSWRSNSSGGRSSSAGTGCGEVLLLWPQPPPTLRMPQYGTNSVLYSIEDWFLWEEDDGSSWADDEGEE